MKSLIDDIRRINKYILFILLCLITAMMAYISSNYLLSEQHFINRYGEQLTFEQIKAIIDMQFKYQWYVYPVIPFVYLLKIFVITLILQAGVIFYNIKIGFKKLFKVVLVAEFIFLLPALIKLALFMFVKTDYDLLEYQAFFPLSALNLVDVNNIPPWLLYPLQMANIFEILYWLALAYGISLATNEKKGKMLGMVACSYGTGLFVWIVFITFISVTLT